MSPFELLFGLTSVILALALTQIANSLQSLLRAGRRVRWAVEPVLQSVLIIIILVFVWVDQWNDRNLSSISVFQSILQVLKLLAVYVVAAAALPEAGKDESVDLRTHYFDSRLVTYGGLATGLILFTAYRYLFYADGHVPLNDSPLIGIGLLAIYLSLMVVRWRPFHVVALILVCLNYILQIAPIEIGG